MQRRRNREKHELKDSDSREPTRKQSSGGRSRVCLFVTVCLIAALIVIILTPSPIDPVVIELAPFNDIPDNSDLRNAVIMFEGESIGPEGFAVDGDGNMYTGLADGRVVRFNDTDITTVVRLGLPPYDKCGKASLEPHCGRALGLETDPNNSFILYIVDSYHGIFKFNLKTEEMKTIVNSSILPAGFPPLKFINDMVILKNRSIFFTDSSSKFARDQVFLEIYEGRANGKLVHYNPIDDSLSVVLSDLYFPNGVSQNINEDFLILAETSKCQILKYHLKGPKVGTVEVFMEGLPGIPDNISPSSSGGFWVGIAATRHTMILDIMAKLPWTRNIAVKLHLPHFLFHIVPKTGMIMEFNEEGTVIQRLYDVNGHKIYAVSEILDMGDHLYLGSFDAPYLARLDMNSVGKKKD